MTSDQQIPITPIAIGHWKPDSDQDLPIPQEFVNTQIPEQDRMNLIKYLSHGKIFISYLGFSFCRFHCGIEDHQMGASYYTDGKYVWPEGLVYYVKDHQVWLPEIFISYSKSNSGFDPVSIGLKKMTFFDHTWWKTLKK